MRDIHIQAIDRKIKRIRFYKTLGIMIFATAVIVSLILIFSTLNTIMMMQTDTLNTIQEVNQAEKIDVSEDLTPLTAEERELIQRVVMSESGNQSLECQMAVAQTINDRMNDFGDTLQVAIETYSQTDNGEPTDSVKLAVANVFDGGMRIYEGGTYQFHDDSVSPYWTSNKIRRGSIGKLTFYGGYEI